MTKRPPRRKATYLYDGQPCVVLREHGRMVLIQILAGPRYMGRVWTRLSNLVPVKGSEPDATK